MIAEDMLQKFGDNDWDALIQVLLERTTGWKRRLAYCFNDSDDLKQLETLLILIDTDDTELFEIAVDSLRNFQDNLVMMKNNNLLIKKIETLMSNAGMAAEKIYQQFLNKFNIAN